MNVSEIIFIVLGAVLGMVALTALISMALSDPWTGKIDNSAIAVAVVGSVLIVASAVTLYISQANHAIHQDTTRQLATSYQTNHPDEKPVTLNLNSDDANEPLPDTPAKDKVTKVFYTSSNGTVVSGGQSDYREALKSDNPVYVFVKR